MVYTRFFCKPFFQKAQARLTPPPTLSCVTPPPPFVSLSHDKPPELLLSHTANPPFSLAQQPHQISLTTNPIEARAQARIIDKAWRCEVRQGATTRGMVLRGKEHEHDWVFFFFLIY